MRTSRPGNVTQGRPDHWPEGPRVPKIYHESRGENPSVSNTIGVPAGAVPPGRAAPATRKVKPVPSMSAFAGCRPGW